MSSLNFIDLPEMLTAIDVAEYLSISRSAAYELVRKPTFPSIRIGRTIRIRRDAFMKWLEEQEASA